MNLFVFVGHTVAAACLCFSFLRNIKAGPKRWPRWEGHMPHRHDDSGLFHGTSMEEDELLGVVL